MTEKLVKCKLYKCSHSNHTSTKLTTEIYSQVPLIATFRHNFYWSISSHLFCFTHITLKMRLTSMYIKHPWKTSKQSFLNMAKCKSYIHLKLSILLLVQMPKISRTFMANSSCLWLINLLVTGTATDLDSRSSHVSFWNWELFSQINLNHQKNIQVRLTKSPRLL